MKPKVKVLEKELNVLLFFEKGGIFPIFDANFRQILSAEKPAMAATAVIWDLTYWTPKLHLWWFFPHFFLSNDYFQFF